MEKNSIVNPALIFLEEDFTNKSDVIHHIARQALCLGYIDDQDKFYSVVMEREEEVPTAIGHGIAIPHGKTDVVKHPFIAFLRTKEVFQWTQGYEQEVQLVFQIGVPSTGTERLHLKFISQLSKQLMHEDFRKQLLYTEDKEKIFELLSSIEV